MAKSLLALIATVNNEQVSNSWKHRHAGLTIICYTSCWLSQYFVFYNFINRKHKPYKSIQFQYEKHKYRFGQLEGIPVGLDRVNSPFHPYWGCHMLNEQHACLYCYIYVGRGRSGMVMPEGNMLNQFTKKQNTHALCSGRYLPFH